MRRTYDEAVKIMVEWWVEKIQAPLNQNNGDNSENGGMAFSLMNMVSMNAQKEITKDKIEIFKTELTESLLTGKDGGRWSTTLEVDYNPGKKLADACKKAGINSMSLPCKTFTFINNDNEVEGRYQYGGEFFKL